MEPVNVTKVAKEPFTAEEIQLYDQYVSKLFEAKQPVSVIPELAEGLIIARRQIIGDEDYILVEDE